MFKDCKPWDQLVGFYDLSIFVSLDPNHLNISYTNVYGTKKRCSEEITKLFQTLIHLF